MLFTNRRCTVIASESYKTFVGDLQADIKTVLYDRPTKATIEYFEGKTVRDANGLPIVLDERQAKSIYRYLLKNDYIDIDDNITQEYRDALHSKTLQPLPEDVLHVAEGVHKLIQAIFDESVLKDMYSDAHATKAPENPLNENFSKKEFQALWEKINKKYAYTAHFDSSELIEKAIAEINEKLFVTQLQYTTTIGQQKDKMNEHELDRGAAFLSGKSNTTKLEHAESSTIKYDLVGKIAEGTTLTRRTVAAILKGLRADKLLMFKYNPEEFITKVIKHIKEQKATMVVSDITYNEIEGKYENTIFTAEKSSRELAKAFKAKKHVQDYVFTDGTAENSVERRFAEDLDNAAEVCVYAKLPKGFHIPTPVGNYSPDWAIAFYEGSVKHICFIAETKGTMDSLNLRPIEQAKIKCAKRLFNELSTDNVKYHDVDSYQSLLDIMSAL